MEKKKTTYAPGTIRAGYSYELDSVVGNLTHMAVGKTLSERMEGESPDFPVVLLENARSLLDSFGQLGPHKSRVLMRFARCHARISTVTCRVPRGGFWVPS